MNSHFQSSETTCTSSGLRLATAIGSNGIEVVRADPDHAAEEQDHQERDRPDDRSRCGRNRPSRAGSAPCVLDARNHQAKASAPMIVGTTIASMMASGIQQDLACRQRRSGPAGPARRPSSRRAAAAGRRDLPSREAALSALMPRRQVAGAQARSSAWSVPPPELRSPNPFFWHLGARGSRRPDPSGEPFGSVRRARQVNTNRRRPSRPRWTARVNLRVFVARQIVPPSQPVRQRSLLPTSRRAGPSRRMSVRRLPCHGCARRPRQLSRRRCRRAAGPGSMAGRQTVYGAAIVTMRSSAGNRREGGTIGTLQGNREDMSHGQ